MLHLPFPSFLLHNIPTHKRRHQQRTSPPYWPQLYTRHILLSIDNLYLFILKRQIGSKPSILDLRWDWFWVIKQLFDREFDVDFHVNWLQGGCPRIMVDRLCRHTHFRYEPIKRSLAEEMFCLLVLNYSCLKTVLFNSLASVSIGAFVIQPS